MFRIATWNVNSLRVRMSHIQQWLEEKNPDVLALQETKITDDDFPVDAFREMGYFTTFSGQKTFNGVATLSKTKQANIISDLPGLDDQQRRVLCADIYNVTVLNLYVPNGSEVGSEKYEYKLKWFSYLQTFVRQLLVPGKNLIILGDFNVAPEDQDVHDPQEWEGSVLVSGPERDEFRKLLDAGLTDCFRMLNKDNDSYTWWDYRAASFRRNRGLRIDHILVSEALVSRCLNCRIDKEPRKLERPSDHAPVVADFDI